MENLETLRGKRVIVRNDRGALFGGILESWTFGAQKLFVKVDTVALSGDWPGDRQRLKKPEVMVIRGDVVDSTTNPEDSLQFLSE